MHRPGGMGPQGGPHGGHRGVHGAHGSHGIYRSPFEPISGGSPTTSMYDGVENGYAPTRVIDTWSQLSKAEATKDKSGIGNIARAIHLTSKLDNLEYKIVKAESVLKKQVEKGYMTKEAYDLKVSRLKLKRLELMYKYSYLSENEYFEAKEQIQSEHPTAYIPMGR